MREAFPYSLHVGDKLELMNTRACARTIHRVQLVAVGIVACVLPSVGVIAPAEAQSINTCVYTSQWTTVEYIRGNRLGRYRRHVRVSNNCFSAVRVQLVWSTGHDPSCVLLRPRTSVVSRAGGSSVTFDGLRTC